MIVKMKFINISGPRNDIDRVTDTYLSKYEIQLESALSELKTVDNLRPFVELNPYRDALSMANKFVGYLDNPDKIKPDVTLALNDMFELVRTANEEYEHLQEKKETTDYCPFPAIGLQPSGGTELSVYLLPFWKTSY